MRGNIFKLVATNAKHLERQNKTKKLLTCLRKCGNINKLSRKQRQRTLITEQWNNLERFKRVSVRDNGQEFKNRAFRQECNLKTVKAKREQGRENL